MFWRSAWRRQVRFPIGRFRSRRCNVRDQYDARRGHGHAALCVGIGRCHHRGAARRAARHCAGPISTSRRGTLVTLTDRRAKMHHTVAIWLPVLPRPTTFCRARLVNLLISLVRAGRLELPRPLGQQILSLPRLPFRHARPRRRDYTRGRQSVNRRGRPSTARGLSSDA